MPVVPQSTKPLSESANTMRGAAPSHASSPSSPYEPSPQVAHAWFNAAPDLASWANQRLVYRRDMWSVAPEKSGNAPRRATGELTVPDLVQSFTAPQHRTPTRRIGLPPIAPDLTCRWIAIELKRQGQSDPAGPGDRLHAALWWQDILARRGFDPVLEEFGPDGHYRLLMLFDFPVDAAKATTFARHLTEDYGHRDLVHPPELFPNEDDYKHAKATKPRSKNSIQPGRAYWLPGVRRALDKKDSFEHITRIWDLRDEAWLEGQTAIDALIGTRPSPEELLHKKPISAKLGETPTTPESDQYQTAPALPTHPTLPSSASPDSAQQPPPTDPSKSDAASEPTPDTHADTPKTSQAEASHNAAQPNLEPTPHTPNTPHLPHADSTIGSIAIRTGLREDEVLRRTFAWLDTQDEVVQALVLGQIPDKIRPDVIRLLADQLPPPSDHAPDPA